MTLSLKLKSAYFCVISTTVLPSFVCDLKINFVISLSLTYFTQSNCTNSTLIEYASVIEFGFNGLNESTHDPVAAQA